MKVRASVMAAVIAAGLCGSAAAEAQGPSAPPAKASAPSVDIVDVAQFFTAPRALGPAWERAVQAVLDGMHALLEEERAAAQQALAALPPKRAPGWQTLPSPVVREPRTSQRVAFHPVAVEPVTQSVVDVRGERAILLGASVELPWMVP